jgi:hypothetical protein
MPSSSFDTFFACTIIVMAVLIATAFLGITLQARISSTEDVNKDSYLKSVADGIMTHPGTPVQWGVFQMPPSVLGLAASGSTGSYELDIDKISRLSSQNLHGINYIDLLSAAQLSSVSLGISVNQALDLVIKTSNTYTMESETYAALDVSTHLNSKACSATVHAYVVAEGYFDNSTVSISDSGSASLTVHVPTVLADDAFVVVFARADCDERLTSYAIYSLSEETQQTLPSSNVLALSPQDHTLDFNNSAGVTLQNVYVLTYSYVSNVTSFETSSCNIPQLIDHSPYVLVACGDNGAYVQEWTSYPQVPLSTGSSFSNQERHVFTYLATVEGVLYRVEISLGDINS